MQPRLTVGVLVLQAEGLVCAIRYLGFLFQTAPADIVAEPQQITVLIGHLTGDANLVTVEVVGLLRLSPSSCGPVPKVRSCRIVGDGLGTAKIGIEWEGDVSDGRYDLSGSRTSILRRGYCCF